MDSITLETVNNSICQLNHRIGDLNNRVDETNNTMRLFMEDNNKSHRTIEKQIDYACRLISNLEKETSVTKQELKDHLKMHKKENEKMAINGVKFTSLFGNFVCAVIGAFTAIYINGLS